MGKRTLRTLKSHTLPSSPTHSSSSSDFEFTIAGISPRSRINSTTNLCPADELFYKGQLLPLHLSPRLSMVRTLLASSSTSSSSDTTTTASRDSSGSSNDSQYSAGDLVLLPDGCDSSRPSSVAEEADDFKRVGLHHFHPIKKSGTSSTTTNKYLNFSLSRFSSVFRKEPKTRNHDPDGISGPAPPPSSSVRRMSTTAKEVIRKYLKKVKPLYEKLSQNQKYPPTTASAPLQNRRKAVAFSNSANVTLCMKSPDGFLISCENSQSIKENTTTATISHSFSGNLKYPRRRRSCVSSCPSSMRSSPSHSGILSRNGFTPPANKMAKGEITTSSSDSSTMEELQSAIQGAIAHCKNSMLQSSHNTAGSSSSSYSATTTIKDVVSNEI